MMFTEICAGDLLGHIFWVPCDPETILVSEYGPKWYKDFPTNKFPWNARFNMNKTGKWTKEDMKEVYKIF
ncbi:hypothetical protein OESDEN_02427 [Oesophagostomum dentatum]|uniref:Uncharacterized protein n=1 Tax=Oesophagostomum dentatum TaxID=61180 RepID=A0A0B1TJ79_OESDE|nr:hypothetical protein OESDEN_02427 [Oesophagostomum dentatum]